MPEITDPELLKRLNAGRTAQPDTAGGGRESQFRLGNEIDLAKGVGLGVADPFVGLAQLVEHVAQKATGRKVKVAPDVVRNWVRDYRKDVQSSAAGISGEVIGNVLPALFSGGTSLTPTIGTRLLAGGVAGALQPVSGSADYWKTKLGQTVMGAGAGATLPALAAAAAAAPRWAASKVLPTAVMHWWPHNAGPGTLTGLAQRFGGGPAGAVAGEYRGTRPFELQRTSEGLPYYQAQPDTGPQTVDRTRKGNLRRGDEDGESQSTSR